MTFFDFHHHHPHMKGIYNLSMFEKIPENQLFSVGIHPKYISAQWEKEMAWIQEVSRNNNCVAIGECGLDAFSETDKALQENIFRKQIEWANEIKKPLIIHCVKRFSEMLHFKKITKVPMIIHGFNKKKSIADELLKKDFYLSFGVAILKNVSLQQIVKDTPIHRFFLETDAAEIPIEEIYEKASDIKEIPLNTLVEQINLNWENLKNG